VVTQPASIAMIDASPDTATPRRNQRDSGNRRRLNQIHAITSVISISAEPMAIMTL